MRKIVLSFLLPFLYLNVFSQIQKGDVCISFNGNYSKSTNESGVLTNSFTTESKNLNIGSSFSYFITNRVAIGIGLDYLWSKSVTDNIQTIPNKFFQINQMDVKTNIYLPNVSVAYYYPIIDKLYFDLRLKCSYGKSKAKYNSTVFTAAYFDDDDDPYTISLHTGRFSSNYKYYGDNENDIFIANINPELTYFLTPSIGISLGLGGLEYSLIDWNTDQYNCAINLNPNYWNLGFRLKL